MGTPAAVAVGTERKWRGRRVGMDGNPQYTGKEVFELCREEGVEGLRRVLRSNRYGFNSFPRSFDALLGSKKYLTERLLKEDAGFYWLYVVDPKRNRLYVFARFVRQSDISRRCSRCGSTYSPTKRPIRWRRIASLSLSGKEPDWKVIEERAER